MRAGGEAMSGSGPSTPLKPPSRTPSEQQHEHLGMVVGGQYCLGRSLGSGSFGDAFLVVHARTGEELAVKLESAKAKKPTLLYEATVLRHLQGIPGVASLHYFGDAPGENRGIVMDLLGPSLERLFKRCNRKFSLKTVLNIADQLLYRVEHLHSKDVIHSDIKPDNLLIGMNKNSGKVHVIDFGLATRYRDLKTHRHIPYREGRSFIGTARYCSINAHLGIEQSRRDDLESVGYVLMYFLRGHLPWQGIQAATREDKNKAVLECKRATSIETLCDGYPAVFAAYFSYCRGLRFETRPDYAYLRRLFRDLFMREGFDRGDLFDWSLPSQEAKGSVPPADAHDCAVGDAAGIGDVGPAAKQVKPRQGMFKSLVWRLSKRPDGACPEACDLARRGRHCSRLGAPSLAPRL